jgi:hypothetical protein
VAVCKERGGEEYFSIPEEADIMFNTAEISSGSLKTLAEPLLGNYKTQMRSIRKQEDWLSFWDIFSRLNHRKTLIIVGSLLEERFYYR